MRTENENLDFSLLYDNMKGISKEELTSVKGGSVCDNILVGFAIGFGDPCLTPIYVGVGSLEKR